MLPKELAIKLAKTETETDIINLLTKEGYWNDFSYWRPFGDNENNFSTIGNQQDKADAALVEKIINSVDAMLMKRCQEEGIDPQSEQAPKSITEALEQFYNIKDGLIQNLNTSERNEISQNIILAATGQKQRMNIVIADKGEGQTPNMMPETILSINKSNKLKVAFVQGKFNMGGTGVLPNCGDHGLELIISKRCPKIIDNSDISSKNWSFTIVRREAPRELRKSSMYTYLTKKDGDLFSFDAESINIIPLPKSRNNYSVYQDMKYGTYLKLYNYNIQGYKSNILFDFNYRLSMLMPDLAHPIRLRECRDYSGHTLETTLSGLITRLNDDRQNNIEQGFPDSNSFYINNQKFGCQIYVFKQTVKNGKLEPTSKNYREDDGLIFIINGQTHGRIADSFFNRVNLSYLAKSLLVIIDCSDIDIISRENMFMNSRDRLRVDDKLKQEVVERIKEILKNHVGLKKLQNERRESAIHNSLSDDKPLQNVLENILNKSPVLSRLLVTGLRLQSPFNLSDNAGTSHDFHGKKHPSFFSLYKGKGNKIEIERPINHGFRVQFETDVENEYFSRNIDPGELMIALDDEVCPHYIRHLGLFNGIATLTINMPKEIVIGSKYNIKVWIDDPCIMQNFESFIVLTPLQPEEYTNGGEAKPKRPSNTDKDKKGNRQSPSHLALPTLHEIYKDKWEEYGMKDESALVVMKTEENTDFYINMDNIHLLLEMKRPKDFTNDEITKAKYKYSMTLIGMSILSYYINNEKENINGDINIEDEVKRFTSIISPILIPLLESMTDLKLD